MTRRYHVFINNEAGSVGDADQQVRDLADEFRRVGVEVSVVAVEPQSLPDAMREAWKHGTDAIVIAGGDGTVNCAAAVAIESTLVLGVLPMGTFNHFAEDLGMPDDLSGAVRFLAQADVTEVDVGEVNGRVFVNNASIGVYPKMVGVREHIRRRRGWGKLRVAASMQRPRCGTAPVRRRSSTPTIRYSRSHSTESRRISERRCDFDPGPEPCTCWQHRLNVQRRSRRLR